MSGARGRARRVDLTKTVLTACPKDAETISSYPGTRVRDDDNSVSKAIAGRSVNTTRVVQSTMYARGRADDINNTIDRTGRRDN